MHQVSRGRRALARRLHTLLTVAETEDGPVAAAPVVPIRQIFRRFWPYARPDRTVIVASLVFVALTPITTAASIWVFKQIVDTVLVGRQLDALWALGSALLGVTIAAGVLSFVASRVSAWLAERFLLRLRDALGPP